MSSTRRAIVVWACTCSTYSRLRRPSSGSESRTSTRPASTSSRLDLGGLPVGEHDRRRDDVVRRPGPARSEAAREEAADDHRAGRAQVAHLRGGAPAQVGAPRLEDDPLSQGTQRRQVQLPRQQGQARVEVEDVEARNGPDEGAELRRAVERDTRAATGIPQLEVDVEPALEGALVEDQERAVDAQLAEALRDCAWAAGDVHGRMEDSHSASS